MVNVVLYDSIGDPYLVTLSYTSQRPDHSETQAGLHIRFTRNIIQENIPVKDLLATIFSERALTQNSFIQTSKLLRTLAYKICLRN